MLIVEKKQMSIKDYQQLIKLEHHMIIVKMKEGTITINGKDLQITYLGQEEIILIGEITNITL